MDGFSPQVDVSHVCCMRIMPARRLTLHLARMPGEGDAKRDREKERRPASLSSDRTSAKAASSGSGASKGGLSEEEMRKRKAAAEAAAKQGGIAPLR